MIQRRSLIVDAFAYCGLFPLKNTVSEDEYKNLKAFQDKTNFQRGGDDMTKLRTIVTSPKKI